jgi:catechol 2,3-dioxygenase-like lactoylglutathione lyase family enzyme
MFANTKAFSGFAVNDLEKARRFYGETLGIKISGHHGLMMLHLAGCRDTLVYLKPITHRRPAPSSTSRSKTLARRSMSWLRGVRLERSEGLAQVSAERFHGVHQFVLLSPVAGEVLIRLLHLVVEPPEHVDAQ